MKTKFSKLVKVKKQKINEIESELLDVTNQKQKMYIHIQETRKEIAEFKKPSSGNFSELNLSYSNLANLSNQKKSYEDKILMFEKQLDGLKELYKEANIEYEKIKHLEDLEIKKQLFELKRKESKDMDEIANLLFAKKNMEFSA